MRKKIHLKKKFKFQLGYSRYMSIQTDPTTRLTSGTDGGLIKYEISSKMQ